MIVSRTGRYSDLKIRETKHSFPVTYPDIFRLRDQNTQYGIFPSSQILNLCSRTILYDSAYKCICEILNAIVHNLELFNCTLLMTHA